MIEKKIMTRIAAVLNRLTKIAKLIFAQSNDAFDNFFSLYQNRLQSYPPEQIAQKMLQEPIFTKFLESAIKTHLKKTYSTHQPRSIEDTAERVFDNIVEKLPNILSSYDPDRGLPLVGWLRSTINQYSKTVYNVGQLHQKELPIDAIYNENNIPSNAGGIVNIPGSEYSQFLPQMQDQTSTNVQNLQFQIENLYEKLYSDELEKTPVARRQELTQAIKNQIADKKNRLKAYYYQQGTVQDNSQMEEYNRQQMVEKSVQVIPYKQLSETIEGMMKYTGLGGYNKVGGGGDNRFYPASAFFKPKVGGNNETNVMLSKILIESMMRAERARKLTNTKNDMFGARDTLVRNNDFKTNLLETLKQKMAEYQIDPEIQKLMYSHVANFSERMLLHKPRELDEMTRMAYYIIEKKNMFPGKEWNQLTDEEKNQITSSVHQQMEYGYGNEMAVRQYRANHPDGGHYVNGIGREVSPTQGLTPELRGQLMLQEVNNLTQDKWGYEVSSTLPYDSSHFYKKKPDQKRQRNPYKNVEPEKQEIIYSPQATNTININACYQQIQSIRTATQTLIEYAEWCDKNELYHEAEITQSNIRKAIKI